jgi:hypothetical protein
VTRARLLACPACARHVRADERACPFCGHELPPGFSEAPAAPSPTVRLSRAALYAVGVGALSLTAAQGCGGTVAGGKGDGGGGTGRDASSQQDGNVAVPYGLPPPFDAGSSADVSSAKDAAADAGSLDAASADGAADAKPDVGIAPPYGGIPPEPEPGGPGEPDPSEER